MSQRVTIGIVAERTGCNIETIRYYEKEGLLPPPIRSQGGHRLYTTDQIERLTFIRRSRELGFSMAEIKQLHSIVDKKDACCESVKKIADDHLEDIATKIADLTKMQSILSELSLRCSDQTIPDCPIISALQGSEYSSEKSSAENSSS